MRLHRSLDHARRQLEEALVERADDDRRALDQVQHLLELAEQVAPRPHRVELLDDQAAPLALVGLDPRVAQVAEVGARVEDLQLGVREAVAEGEAAGADACHLELDRLGVELGEQPAQGPREAQAAGVPGHRLAEGEAAHDLGQQRRQHLAHRLARHLDAEAAVALDQVGRQLAVLAREARDRLLVHRRRRALDPGVGGALGQALDDDRQPPRPDEHAGRFDAHVLRAEHRQLGQSLAAGRGGQLLDADLEQQVRHRAAPARATRAPWPHRACRPRGPGCGRGRCRRRARSPRWRRGHRAG